MSKQSSDPGGAVFTMVQGHHILSAPIGSQSIVLDCGANHGEFAKEIQSRYGCSPMLVEANPYLCEEITQSSRCHLLNAAVAGSNGTLRFNIALNDEGSSIRALPTTSALGCVCVSTVEVPAKTLAEVCAHFGLCRIDLLKIDIEGAEVEVLENCPAEALRRICQITVEFHCADIFGFGGREAVEAVIRRLRSLGFTAYVFDPNLMDVLFVNHASLGTPLWKQVVLRLRTSRPHWLGSLWRLMPSVIRNFVRIRFGATKE